MTVDTKISNDGKKVTISVIGKFDFTLNDAFKNAYLNTIGSDTAYFVGFSRTNSLDSSAPGMLLLLREHAGNQSSDIRISDASGEVQKVLDVANFVTLFNLPESWFQ
jgi:anti-anti-sigma regulatory factor